MGKTVVLLGDSMVDTFDFMGQGFPELKLELEKLRPNNTIQLKNHGVGTTDIALGLERITKRYNYQERNRQLPAVLDENPNLVVVESFVYNHWSDSSEDLQKYIDYHKKIIKALQDRAKILLMATVAPNKETFAQGVLSLGWDKKKQQNEYSLVMRYFEEFISFAKQSGLPFLDLFTRSLTEENTGDLKYISNVDYIHLSYEGRLFIAQKLAPEITNLLGRMVLDRPFDYAQGYNLLSTTFVF